MDKSMVGWLKTAVAAGAMLMSWAMNYFPISKHAGKIMLGAVIGFGLSIIGFGLSDTFWLAYLFLFTSGAFDSISVVVRYRLLHDLTPENMKGRVSSVKNIFVGSSNEIGAFESGITSHAFGLRRAILAGGGMTILVVLASYFGFKTLRNHHFEKEK